MENIAIVGIANLFPGSKAPEDFWQALLNKQDCRTQATHAQMGVAPEKYLGQKGDADKYYCVHGGYINQFDFDASGYAIDSAYLEQLDDLNHWALYVTKQALKDAGYWNHSALDQCGLILGNLSFPTKSSNHLFLPLYHQVVDNTLKQLLHKDFQLSHFTDAKAVHPDNALVAGYPSSLVAQASGLGAAHFSLDAACASSCYSVKLACDYLHTGKADMMLAGAVSAADPMFVNMGFSIFQAYPGNNVHAPLDKNSQGLFAGEGAGMMVLKRESDAMRDGDNILAIIKGGALTNDGKGEFVLSPNTKGQVLAYQRAYDDAGVDPADVDFIECHATGTPKGDKVELASMESFFSASENKPLLGSVKSNLGHLLTAAGMPGMTKTVLALNAGIIPPTINIKEALSSKNAYFGAAQIPTETVAWPSKETSSQNQNRIAGVSVFGFGGSNAHLVLQQANSEQKASQERQVNFEPAKKAEPLAIIGMDAHFGSAKSLAEFKTLLDTQKTTFRSLPKNRWKGMETDANVMDALNLSTAPKGGYVEDFEIDFLRFKVPPNEQDCLIPQQLMMMKVADNAAKDAGLKEGSNVAVLVAMGLELELHQYRGRVNLSTQIEESLQQQGIQLTDAQQQTLTNIAKDGLAFAAQLNQYTSFIGNIMASRISALWDFSGPAFTISAEENSVFRCLEVADNLCRTSEVDAVIIASVDLAGSLENISLRQNYGKVSETASPSHDEVLDQNTWFVGEGAAAIVVKPQSKVAEGSVYASIDGLSFENGCESTSIALAANKALKSAGITQASLHSVEAHASGFVEENQAEKIAFSKVYPGVNVLSVKSQVGHTFNASGLASIVKSALVLDSLKNNMQRKSIAINSLGRDNCSAHLIISASDSQHQSMAHLQQPLTQRRPKPSLIKTITLGGELIAESITKNLSSEPFASIFDSIKAHFDLPTLKPVSRPLDISKLPLNVQQEVKGNKLALQTNTHNQTKHQTQEAHTKDKPIVGVNVKSKASQNIEQQTACHQAFLQSRQVAQQQLGKMIELQAKIVSGQPVNRSNSEFLMNADLQAQTQTSPELHVIEGTNSSAAGFQIKGPKGYQYPPLELQENYAPITQVIYDTKALVEFAEGDIAKVFGPEYSVIDGYARRVRLPTTDYLLVSRVTDLDAEINQYKKSYMATEYDIPIDAPFLIDGQIPWSVAVESGQCDLMLISYIGIDFQAKGERVYRLLDCELTFLEDMAFGGQTLRYEIHIDSYAKNGDQLLFFFHYDCYVDGKKVLIMRNGCAGFFTDEELSDGKGVIHNDKDKAQLANAKPSYFKPFIENDRREYGYDSMLCLVNGDIEACFGANYFQGGRNPSLKFSSEKFLMIERVTKIDPQGGHWGLGLLEGQKDLNPEHWYFPCHFKGDQVMAGSLMSEGCGQMAMFFMLFLGMHTQVNNARFQPLADESQTVRCRGQVLPQTNTLTYRMEVCEMGMLPHPYMKANIDIILDGKVVVDFKNLCIQITEQDEMSPYPVQLPSNVARLSNASLAGNDTAFNKNLSIVSISPKSDPNELVDETGKIPFQHPNRPLMRVESDLTAPLTKGVIPIKHFSAPDVPGDNRQPNTVPFTPWHMFEFATGNISNCFGPDFDVYQGRIPPRTPCGDLQVVTRVTDVQGTRLDLKNPSSCIAEYYVPEDAWYFTKNSHDSWMPYSLIMEIALQPNGFISGYMGTTLKYPEKDLFFRNLDGTGKLLKQIDLRGKTIVNKSVLVNTSIAGGAIIQSFTFDLSVDGVIFYTGKAVFGYFSADSLTNQLGMDKGQTKQSWFAENGIAESEIEVFYLNNKQCNLYHAPEGKPHYRLAGGQMNFIDKVSIVEGGGDGGVAYVHGERTVDASDWFFRYHFHQDPVMPGSLGVEAIIELLQTYALKNDLGAEFTNPRFVAPLTEVEWKYRGQITPVNKQMSLDVHITDIIREPGEVRIVGDANLSKDGLRIYHVKNIVLSIIENLS